MNRHALLRNKENLRKLLETLIQKAAGTPIVAPLHTYVRDAIKGLGIGSSQPPYHATAKLSCFWVFDEQSQGNYNRLGQCGRRSYLLGNTLHYTKHVCRAPRNLAVWEPMNW